MVKKAEFIPSEHETVFEVVHSPQREEQKTDAEARTDFLVDALTEDSEAFVSIYREGLGPPQYCDRIPADKYDVAELMEYLKKDFGPGDYRVRVYVHKKMKANKLITIAGTTNKEIVPLKNTGGEVNQILGTILQTIQQQNRELVDAIRGGSSSRREMLEEMMLYKQLFDNGGNNNSFSQLNETIEFLGKIGLNIGEQKEDDGIMGFLGSIAEPLGEIVQGVAKSQKTEHAKLPQKQLAKPESKKVIPNPKTILIKKYIGILIKGAEKNSEPGMYADLILDQIPEKFVVELYNILNGNDWLKTLVGIDARVQKYASWFTNLRNEIILILTAEDESEIDETEHDIQTNDDSGRHGGNPGNIETNEGTGT